MKKALIVFGTTAALLAGVLSPTTGFAAENVGSNEPQNGINNASKVNTDILVFVGSATYLSGSKFYAVHLGSEYVSVDMGGRVYGLKKGFTTVKGYDKEGNHIITYYVKVI